MTPGSITGAIATMRPGETARMGDLFATSVRVQVASARAMAPVAQI